MMVRLSKCPGFDCPDKENCFRYKITGGMLNSVFTSDPRKDGKCDFYKPMTGKSRKRGRPKKVVPESPQ